MTREWQRVSSRFLTEATCLLLDAGRVLDLAHGLDTSAWTDDDLDVAMEAMTNAYNKLERADVLEDVAVRLRMKYLGGIRRAP